MGPFGRRAEGFNGIFPCGGRYGGTKKEISRLEYLFFVGTRPRLFLTFSLWPFRCPLVPIPNCNRLTDGSPLPHGGDGSRIIHKTNKINSVIYANRFYNANIGVFVDPRNRMFEGLCGDFSL